MKKAISLMLVLILALTMLGVPALSEEVAAQGDAAPEGGIVQYADPPESAPAQDQPKAAVEPGNPRVAVDQVAMYQKSGKALPDVGFPMTKNNKLIVRVAVAGGHPKTTAKARVSIGTDIADPAKDLAKVTLDKCRLSGKTEFSFTLKSLAKLTSGAEYKVFFQSAKTKNNQAVQRTEIGKLTVLSQKDVDRIKAERKEGAGDAAVGAVNPSDVRKAQNNNKEETDAKPGASVAGEKDLRQKLTIQSVSMTPADGKLSSTASAVTVTVNIFGGKKNEYVQACCALLNAKDEVVAETVKSSMNTLGITTFTFLAADLSALANDASYDVALISDQTDFYAPVEALKLGVKVQTGALREARPALGAITIDPATWDLTADADKDVTLKVAASPAVHAAFTLQGKNTKGEDELITVASTLDDAEETEFKFAAKDLARLAPSAPGGAYKIVVNTDASAAYKPGPKDEDTKLTLTVSGGGRTQSHITGGAIDKTNFVETTLNGTEKIKQYRLQSGNGITIEGVDNDVASGKVPVQISIGTVFKYVTELEAGTGDLVVPAALINASTLRATVKKVPLDPPDPNDPDAEMDQDDPYPVTVQILGTDTIAESAARSVGTLSIAGASATPTVVDFKYARVTNGTHSTTSFALARGVNQSLKVDITLSGGRVPVAGEKIDLRGTLRLNYAVDTGKVDASGKKVYDVGDVYKERAFDFADVSYTGTTSGQASFSTTFEKDYLNALKEGMYFFTMKLEGTDKVKPRNFVAYADAVGALTLGDAFKPTPVYTGKAAETRSWTKGGGQIELKDYIKFDRGVKGRVMMAHVYAVPTTKLTSLITTAVAPTGSVLIAKQNVYTDGTTSKFTLTKKGLEKLTGGKDYYLYIQGQPGDYNFVTQIGKSGTADVGYMGKIAVKAASSGGGGGGGGGGSSGGGGSDGGGTVDNSDSATDGGTDTVAGDKSAGDTADAGQIAFGPYSALDLPTLEWMMARQPLMGREFLKYLLNQKGSQKVAIPLAHVADMADPVKVPIVGGGQYDLGLAIFTPAKGEDGEATGYLFTVEPKAYADTKDLKMHLGTDFEDLGRSLTDADYYKPGDFVPVSTLKLAQLDGTVAYDPAAAEQLKIDSAVTNKITEWMNQG